VSGSDDRWTLPDLDTAIGWCRFRNARGIRCVLDVLGEFAQSEQLAAENMEHCSAALEAIGEHELDASLTVKPTALGALIDEGLCRRHVLSICRKADDRGIGFEMDIEGRRLVEMTIQTAIACAERGFPVRLAVQAYLDRTPSDIRRLVEHGISVRLVKGAYLGDTDDNQEIRRRFKVISTRLLALPIPFAAGTHDRELVAWLLQHAAAQRERVEFSFLKGLADETKMMLAGQGWCVSEYVPFGERSAAYVARREAYLSRLAAEGRAPVP
jgi:proline dehydrogenase